jgi:hypothetical protein
MTWFESVLTFPLMSPRLKSDPRNHFFIIRWFQSRSRSVYSIKRRWIRDDWSLNPLVIGFHCKHPQIMGEGRTAPDNVLLECFPSTLDSTSCSLTSAMKCQFHSAGSSQIATDPTIGLDTPVTFIPISSLPLLNIDWALLSTSLWENVRVSM